MKLVSIVLAAALLPASIGIALAATPDQPLERAADAAASDSVWTVSGTEFKLRFNTGLFEAYGVGLDAPEPTPGQAPADAEFFVLDMQPTDGLQFNAPRGFDRFVGGVLRVDGGFSFILPNGERLAFNDFQIRPSRSNPMQLDVVGKDGRVWLYINHLMFRMVDDNANFYIRSADLRATAALAERAGVAELANAYLGEIKMMTRVVTAGRNDALAGSPTPDFHGSPAPGGGTFEADVTMESFDMQFMRCRLSSGSGTCDGAGPDNGEVVFAPNSTLRNSNLPNSADVSWYAKFQTSPYDYPYAGNDQHPYLIWNIYRVVDGQLEQVGASGLKHAFLTTNTGGNDCGWPFGNMLGRDCRDTYGTGNNDSASDLGPRSELIAATGYWGRCGSIFDTNCDGGENASGNGQYGSRLIVRESQLSVPGAQYYSDSWYVVQDDINIYNTMTHRTMAPASGGGGGWTPGSQGPNVVGSVMDTWVNPVANPNQNVEIDTAEGHTKVAVKVKTLDACPDGSSLTGTCYRYDYVVNNLDFGRAKTEGDPPNLRVLSNLGFRSVTIPTAFAPVFVEPDAGFADIDIDAGNDWTVNVDDVGITWTAPAGNELNWGTLYRFSFISSVAPDPSITSNVALTVADDSSPDVLEANLMVPQGDDNDVIFLSSFEFEIGPGG
jgi:hypothetical protein